MWMCQSRKGLLLLHDVYAWRNGRIAAWMDVDRWRRWQENRQFPKRGFAVCSPGTLQRCHSYGGFADRCCWPGIWRWKPWGNSVGADFVGDFQQRGTARGIGRRYCGVMQPNARSCTLHAHAYETYEHVSFPNTLRWLNLYNYEIRRNYIAGSSINVQFSSICWCQERQLWDRLCLIATVGSLEDPGRSWEGHGRSANPIGMIW